MFLFHANILYIDPTICFTNAMIKTTDILNRREISQLRSKSSLKGILLVAHAWGVITLTMMVNVIWPNPLFLLLGIFIVGARQLGLAILMHDAAHGLLSPHLKFNDFLGNVLCAWPQGLNLYEYRPYHMKHHRFTQQENDPDLVLSRPFPISKASLMRKIARDLLGLTFLRLRFFQLKNAWSGAGLSFFGHVKKFITQTAGFFISNIILWFICFSFGHGEIYFLLWLLPLATSYQLVARIRNIAEHAVVPDDNDDFKNTRTTNATMLERIFIAPYWVNYHIEHHLFMFTPCYNLPQAHVLLGQKNLWKKMEIKNNYLSVLKSATQPAQTQ